MDEKGTSLIEVLLAIIFLGILIVSISSLYLVTHATIHNVEEKTEIILTAQSKMDTLISTGTTVLLPSLSGTINNGRFNYVSGVLNHHKEPPVLISEHYYWWELHLIEEHGEEILVVEIFAEKTLDAPDQTPVLARFLRTTRS